MKLLRLRFLLVVLVSMLMAGGSTLGQVAAQDDATPAAEEADESVFDAYRAETRLAESAYGPEQGTLTHDAEKISFVSTDLNVQNFYAKIRVIAPYDGEQELWDAGFQFRVGRDVGWRIVVSSNGEWALSQGSADPIQTGTVSNLATGEGDRNDIELAVEGDTGYLAVNREDAATFDLSQRSVRGNIQFGVTFTEAATQAGTEVEYSRFQIWELDESSPAEIDGDAADLLAQGRDIADTGEPIAGPFSGDIKETAESVSVATLGVETADFYAKVEAVTPRDAETNPFDLGFGFRDSGGNNQYRLIFSSDGEWFFKIGVGAVIAAQNFDGLKTGADETNLLELAVSGDVAVFAVNGEIVGSVNTGELTDPGDIAIGAGFYPIQDIVEGDVTEYSDFAAWDLVDGADGPATEEATEEPTEEVTEEATEEPTEEATEEATEEPTEEATEEATEEPTEEVTEEATEEPTEEATEEATEEPTEEATEEATPDTREPSEIYEDTLEATDDFAIAFGPEEGELALEPDALAFVSSESDLTDFVLHAEFTNPYAASEGGFDFGVLFRLGADEPHLRLIVLSSGDWVLTPSTEEPIESGTVDNLKLRANQLNAIDLVVIGDNGYFGVNGDFVSELDLSTVTQSGDVALGSSFFQGNFLEGTATGYEDFIIWEIPAAEETPEPDVTETAEPDETETAEPDETPVPVDDADYQSDLYGYAISYDNSWSEVDQSVEDGVDFLRITNDVSTVDFTGSESDLTPVECIDNEFEFYQTADGYSDAQLALDVDDNEMRGEIGDDAWGVFWFTFTDADDVATEYTAYVECRPIGDGQLLRIVQYVPIDDYNDQIDARVKLLDGLTLTGNDEPEDVTPEPEETEGPTDDPTEEATEAPEDETPETSEATTIAIISEVDNSGVEAIGTISEDGRRSSVLVLAIGVEDGTVAIIQEGSCADLPGEPAYLLKPVETSLSESSVRASFEDLASGDFVITLHENLDDLSQPLACGVIEPLDDAA